MFRLFAKLFTDRRAPARAHARKPLSRGARLELEHLEDRITPNAAWGLDGPPLVANTGGAANVALVNGDAGGSASITKKNEVDFFKFTTREAGFYTLRATASFDVVAGLYTTGSSGKLLAYADRFGANATESFSVFLEANKTYALGVTNYRTTPGGNYTWAIDDMEPAPGNPTVPEAKRHLYAQFDGAFFSASDLQTWDDDWQLAGAVDFDTNGDGITIQPFLSSNSLYANREAIITGVLSNMQTDLAPFGVRVVRLEPGQSAVAGVGATTLFFGVSDLDNGYKHVACDIDVGNNNVTDIGFVYDEYWGGNSGKVVLAISDVGLHEAGHTYGLFHVNSGTNLETMGIRYSVSNQSYWPNDTSYMNQSFDYRDFNGSQNTYQEVARAFGIGNPLPPAPPVNPSLADYLAEERAYSHAHDEAEHSPFAFKDGDEHNSSADVISPMGTLTGDATTQAALNVAKQGTLTITISNVAGLGSGDTLVDALVDARFYLTVATNNHHHGHRLAALAPTAVTTSGNSVTITFSLKDSRLPAALGRALADNTSAATAVEAGFRMESPNYTLTDDYLTRLFSTKKFHGSDESDE